MAGMDLLACSDWQGGRSVRVVQYSGYMDPAGRAPQELLDAWTTLVDVASAAAAWAADVTVVQAAAHDAEIERSGVRFVFVRQVRVPKIASWLGYGVARYPVRAALDVVADLAPELVHVQGLSFPFHVHALARRLRTVPLLAQDHADRVRSGWRRSLQRWGLRPLSGVAFTAAEQARPFLEAGVLRPEVPIFEVIEGSTRFEPLPRAAARRAIELSGDPAVLWVGHLTAAKDPITALEAVAKAVPRLPALRFWMIYQRDDLLEQVKAWLGRTPEVASRAVLVGPTAHQRIPQFMSAADILLSASHREGSGYAVIEAQACGTAVVASDVPSHRRMLAGSKRAALAPIGDARGLATGIVKLAGADTHDRAAARAHFERHLSLDALGRELTGAYRTLLTGGAGLDRDSR